MLIPNSPVTDSNGRISLEWYWFFEELSLKIKNSTETGDDISTELKELSRKIDALLGNIQEVDSRLQEHINDTSKHYSMSSIIIKERQVTDLDKYKKEEVDALLDSKEDKASLARDVASFVFTDDFQSVITLDGEEEVII